MLERFFNSGSDEIDFLREINSDFIFEVFLAGLGGIILWSWFFLFFTRVIKTLSKPVLLGERLVWVDSFPRKKRLRRCSLVVFGDLFIIS
ncbi:MAG: hypothetical protein ACD_83C00049G0001 [uncultured bacterium]|nr:MAG: hypothetical protein ACD_83C00049G0001 [uncultured bacterium]